MKILSFISILFLSSCALYSNSSKNKNLTYENIRKLQVGISTENEVIQVLGEPTKKEDEAGYYTLVYNDPTSDYQRFSVNILNESHKVIAMLWVPKITETESILDHAKAGFPQVDFKEVDSSEHNPHAFHETISLVNTKLGITIRYDKEQHLVEAIAIYDPTQRLPAETKEKIPYTL